MKSLPFLLLLFASFTAKSALSALVLVDSYTYTNLLPLLTEWRAQVHNEGRYLVDMRSVPRAGRNNTNRVALLEANRALIHAAQPSLVQIIGCVPIGISGWQAADGHEARCVYTDAAYMCDRSVAFTDTVNYGTHSSMPGWNNMAGDGRWDANNVTQFRRPVARIDFSEVPYVPLKVNKGCKIGQPLCPALDEQAELRSYFQRNLAFRRGPPRYNRTAIIHGTLYDLCGVRTAIKTTMSQFQWLEYKVHADATPVAGRRTYLLWSCYGRDEQPWYYDDLCNYVDAVWVNVYRSFAMEQYDAGAPMRRWLQKCLVTTWGCSPWYIPPGARSVGDAIQASIGRYSTWSMVYTALGDATLPINVFSPNPNPTHGLRN